MYILQNMISYTIYNNIIKIDYISLFLDFIYSKSIVYTNNYDIKRSW